jgi:hypothetical protein
MNTMVIHKYSGIYSLDNLRQIVDVHLHWDGNTAVQLEEDEIKIWKETEE